MRFDNMTQACCNCAHWDTKDSMTGYCQRLTDAVRDEHQAHGLAILQTQSMGGCDEFEPSVEAQLEAESVRRHQNDLWHEAGDSYPLSLGHATACSGTFFDRLAGR